ncbi:methionine biosynthesis protein MetW [Azospira inquinata]|uniref:Methionine biosynthesis protein MetW n=1 Tax=Azospira inquinata TaxID=2785627 RepID=A0A975SPQ0_9RHOO|nr:methionine biosynthesis protein MetW [Azospira inquinata]QWT47139.1 methionine biosynthesis protein MetW [Azospira inquinata]QWT50232.1 methionine biosynthesis protein MetW [Azospira inquinata]
MTNNAIDRFDFDAIANWIAPGERVLDLGCGDGSLLGYLRAQRGIRGYGVEIAPDKVLACMANGVNVIQTNLDQGLVEFEDGFFDHVIMSLSLQTVKHTERLLQEMLRVGAEAVVSFPNFAYWRHRQAILNGRMPVSKDLPYQWYDSPNVRFFTIADFEALCREQGIVIKELKAFDNGKEVTEEPNFLASMALCRLGRA